MLNSQEAIEAAKILDQKIKEIAVGDDRNQEILHTIMIFAGVMTETLLEYEEPDVIMEQSIHRIAGFLDTNPVDDDMGIDELLRADVIDKHTEYGRELARMSSEQLPDYMDDVHEIAIALVLNAFPLWEEECGQKIGYSLRLFVEYVIAGLTFEMSVQEFCEIVIEDFITSGISVNAALSVLSGAAGAYAGNKEFVDDLLPVIGTEASRHGVLGMKNWDGMETANDFTDENLNAQIKEIRIKTDSFFDDIGLEDVEGRATVMAKTAGRMMAVSLIGDDDMQAPSALSKSLIRTSLIQGVNFSA